MQIPLDILAKAGHPKRGLHKLKVALASLRGGPDRDGDPNAFDIRLYRDIRGYCDDCSGGDRQDRLKCAIINCPNCPLWAFRMGKNPYNSAGGRNKGLNPFANLPKAENES